MMTFTRWMKGPCMQYFASVVSDEERIESVAAVLQALSDPTPLRIMALVCRANRDLCVCEFVDALEEPQYHVSRSLKVLRKAGWLAERRERKWVYHGAAPELDEFRARLLKAIAASPEAVPANDQRELKQRLKLRENDKCLLGVQKTHLMSRRN